MLSAPAPIPDPQRFNGSVHLYTNAVQQVATELNCAFVDLFDHTATALNDIDGRLLPDNPMADLDVSDHPELMRERFNQWTANGMHFNDVGYERMACLVRERLFNRPIDSAHTRIDFGSKNVTATGSQLKTSSGKSTSVQFSLKLKELSPVPCIIDVARPDYSNSEKLQLTVKDSNGDIVLTTTSDSAVRIKGNDGTSIDRFLVPSSEYAALRDLVMRKNELYFHRWRPQNITYLFGFRKHEQGNNAVEIAQFDPLIDQLEEKIHAAQQPGWHTIEVSALP